MQIPFRFRFSHITIPCALVVLMLGTSLNQWLILDVHSMMRAHAMGAALESSGAAREDTQSAVAALYGELIPQGVPAMEYGRALSVNFSDPVAAIPILESYDRGDNTITLEGDLLERYKTIGMSTSCEYCCGAKTLVFPDGKPACGCAHSAAMRGLAAYLLTTRGSEFKNEDILNEVNRWKAVFFPKQTISKALQARGIDPTSAGLPSMVGGC